MRKFLKIAIILLISGSIYSCAGKKQLSDTENSRAAQDRINAGQSGGDSVLKDLY